jgi:hypothetical protein
MTRGTPALRERNALACVRLSGRDYAEDGPKAAHQTGRVYSGEGFGVPTHAYVGSHKDAPKTQA